MPHFSDKKVTKLAQFWSRWSKFPVCFFYSWKENKTRQIINFLFGCVSIEVLGVKFIRQSLIHSLLQWAACCCSRVSVCFGSLCSFVFVLYDENVQLLKYLFSPSLSLYLPISLSHTHSCLTLLFSLFLPSFLFLQAPSNDIPLKHVETTVSSSSSSSSSSWGKGYSSLYKQPTEPAERPHFEYEGPLSML